MREIVHIQAGQCGNQIGAKVNTMFLYFFTVFLCNRLRMRGRHFVTPPIYSLGGKKRQKANTYLVVFK